MVLRPQHSRFRRTLPHSLLHSSASPVRRRAKRSLDLLHFPSASVLSFSRSNRRVSHQVRRRREPIPLQLRFRFDPVPRRVDSE
ncbi:hypothetical protein F2Q68_00041747 [Brassica cretica]|uniref:Uncharacterized protein n=1 Tax=Brassica cretica TaxID=69181 RepID=A0A8S9MDH7_BRACR|nr:hypothetical protein F2Q68_00041747 [Brassica cretica]